MYDIVPKLTKDLNLKFSKKENIAFKYSIRKTLQRKNKYQNIYVVK